VLSENVAITVNTFALEPKYRFATHDRVAVMNTRGEGNVVGYVVAEPLISDVGLVIGKEQRILLGLMSLHGTAITSDNLLMSQ
jgi:hypothetical protein